MMKGNEMVQTAGWLEQGVIIVLGDCKRLLPACFFDLSQTIPTLQMYRLDVNKIIFYWVRLRYKFDHVKCWNAFYLVGQVHAIFISK